jgi:hypothetical protein
MKISDVCYSKVKQETLEILFKIMKDPNTTTSEAIKAASLILSSIEALDAEIIKE